MEARQFSEGNFRMIGELKTGLPLRSASTDPMARTELKIPTINFFVRRLIGNTNNEWDIIFMGAVLDDA